MTRRSDATFAAAGAPRAAGPEPGPAAARGAVHFEIGHVTLHGYPPADRARFVASLRASLTELGARGDWSPDASAPRRLSRVDAGPRRPGSSPEDAARVVAARVRAAVAPAAREERPR